MSTKEGEARDSLFLAVSCGKLEEVKELVNEYGLSYSPEFCDGYALLSSATVLGHTEIVKFLLTKGAIVNSRVSCVNTPLHFAAWLGNTEVTNLLVDHEALIDAKDERYVTPLYLACQRGNENMVQLLLGRGADPNVVREPPPAHKNALSGVNVFREPLEYSAQTDDSDNHKPLPSLSENDQKDSPENHDHKNNEDESHTTPLHIAVQLGHLKVIELLLNNGANVNAQTAKGSTPLILALANGHTDIAEMLVERGACIYTSDKNHCSPLYFAVQKRYTKMVQCLLNHEATVYDPNPDRSPLHLAVESGMQEIVALLLDSGFDVNTEDTFGETLLLHSVQNKKEGKPAETTQVLLDHGADLNRVPNILHEAVKKMRIDVCQILIKNGANVNGLDTLSSSVLSSTQHVGSVYQRAKALFLSNVYMTGDMTSIFSNPGYSTPVYIASDKGYVAILDLLLNNGANVEAPKVNGLAPLHIAALKGQYNIVKTLLNFNADIDILGSSNETALHYAVLGSREMILRLLLDNGCDVNIESMDSETAFELVVPNCLKPVQAHIHSSCLLDREMERWRNQSCKYKMFDIFKNHLIKLKVLGVYINERLLQHFSLERAPLEFQEKCEEEVGRMKSEIILGQFTLHHVMTKQTHPRQMRNKLLVTTLENFNFNRYPIYKKLLLNTFEKKKGRLKLLDAGRAWLHSLMKTSNALNEEPFSIPSVLQLEEIVSNLSMRDLKNLIICGEALKKQLCH